MDKIYFAHCMADYGQPSSQVALSLVKRRFPEWFILNPEDHAEDYKRWLERLADHRTRKMQFFTDLVKTCDALVFLFSDPEDTGRSNFYLGAGVAQEILAAHVRDMPVFQVKIESHEFGGTYASLEQSTVFQDVLTIEETRELIARPASAELAAAEAEVEAAFGEAGHSW